MVRKSLNLILMALISISFAFPQGRGGRQGDQQRMEQTRGGGQAGSGPKEQERNRLNTRQRDEIRACDRLADGIRKQARAMGKSAGNSSSADQLSGQRDQLRSRIREMEQEHERMMNGVNQSQQQGWQELVRNTNQIRERLHAQLKKLDTEVDGANPDPKRIREQTREIEKTMMQWREEYSRMSSR